MLNPWDLPAPNADDPAPRIARPIPARDLHAIFRTHRPVVALNDDRPDLYESLCSEAAERDAVPTSRSAFAFWSSLLFWTTIIVCYLLLASGKL